MNAVGPLMHCARSRIIGAQGCCMMVVTWAVMSATLIPCAFVSRDSGVHIRQNPPAHVTTINIYTCVYIYIRKQLL